MSTNTSLRQAVKDIADAIRAKGVTGTMSLSEMPTKVASIPSGGASAKYGVPLDGMVGDLNASGVIQPPSQTFSFSSTEIKSLVNNTLTYKFYGNTALTSVNLPNLTDQGANGLDFTFCGCTNLTSVNLPKLASGTLSGAFRECTSLTSIELPEFNGSLSYTFYGCSNLVSFSAPKMTTGSMASPFTNCTKLQTVDLSGLTTTYLSSTFYGLTALRTMKLNHYSGTLSDTFLNCSNLEVVDFHETTAIPTLSNTSTFTGTNNTYRIIVPNALYDQWIAASNWSDASIKPHIEKFIKGLVAKAVTANSTIRLDAVGTPPSLDLEYSTDGGVTFAPYIVGTAITLSSIGDTVLFRAGTNGNNALATDASNYHRFSITGSVGFEDSLVWLLDSQDTVPQTLSDYAFYGLFDGCSGLTTAPELPFTSLGERSYAYMFNGCSGLTNAPAINATALDDYCYEGMFKNCTSITTAPELPATTLATGCYNEMFYGCSSLNHIKLSYTGNFSTTYFNNWVYDVAASGEIEYQGQDTTTGPSAIPSGWTVQTIHYMNYINTNIAEMNTGVVPTTSTRIVGRFRGDAVGNWFVGIPNHGWGFFNAGDNRFYFEINGMSGRLMSNAVWDKTKWYDISVGNFYATATPETGTAINLSGSTKSFTLSNNLILGSSTYNWGGVWEQFDCAGFKIYEGNTLVKDFRPALDPNSAACFYEELSGTYYYPSTGTFLAY